jgi:hypothetical protein
MPDTSERLPTIEDNCRISLANLGQSLKPADTGAIAALLRVARLCDSLLDAGETKDLAPLLSRLHSIMDSLHMTPKSRADQAAPEVKDATDVKTLSEAYLRIVQTPSGDDAPKRAKPRTPSKSTNGDGGGAPTRVAKVRPRSGVDG